MIEGEEKEVLEGEGEKEVKVIEGEKEVKVIEGVAGSIT